MYMVKNYLVRNKGSPVGETPQIIILRVAGGSVGVLNHPRIQSVKYKPQFKKHSVKINMDPEKVISKNDIEAGSVGVADTDVADEKVMNPLMSHLLMLS